MQYSYIKKKLRMIVKQQVIREGFEKVGEALTKFLYYFYLGY